MIKNFLRDETGLELSEYAVAASLIVITTVIGFELLGSNITDRINRLENFVSL